MPFQNRAPRAQSRLRQIKRLETRAARLQQLSGWVSWLRAMLALAAGLVALDVFGLGALATWTVVALLLWLFVLVVAYDRRLVHWARAYRAAGDLRADQAARMTLDWEQMRGAVPVDVEQKNSLALDLDLLGPRSLHQLLDTTLSWQASRMLAGWLTGGVPDVAQIAERQSIVRELAPLNRFRERFWLTYHLGVTEPLQGENLVAWLQGERRAPPPGWALPAAIVLVASTLGLLALMLAASWPPYFLISLALYAALYFSSQSRLNGALAGLVELNGELEKFAALLRYLESFDYSRCPHLAVLCAPFRDPHRSPSAQLRRVKVVTFATGLRSNAVLALILNLILPWDFIFASLAGRYRDGIAGLLPQWVAAVEQVDALIALGNFAALNPEYSFPDISAGAEPALRAEQLGHPLISPGRRVLNDFAVQRVGELALITGSNMAGKSTFLRTVGINLCLAYTGAPVAANLWQSLPFRLHTCMRISDSVVEGFSYFYSEVRCLKHLLEELSEPNAPPVLYLIDEIFRGTNNRERLIGSRAYIAVLRGANGVGLLATHDLELAKLADEHVRNYHFRDSVSDGRLVFDYLIRTGPSPTTNALKIMQLEGLPVDTAEGG